ncbi:hypothetical protein SASC598O02_003450 [Snodgrassella alvi SCGC AB-598-O02]|nr:hypothetical protein SASC598O02_008200 [Snodgrassella alvi SCGC AB-598-O02]KES11595.1 hypothetical protein SASC598O02_003450 [Snodgrassella alvi SCGC AB-598-O02]
MNNDYLDNQDKYMYGVCLRYKKDVYVYENTYHSTIAKALSAIPFFKADSPAEVKIAVRERGDLFKPSECNAFDKDAITDLLDESDEMVQSDYFPEAGLFNLKDEEIQELKKLINDFLDQKIDTTGYYKAGKFIEIITLTREQYTKYL